MKTKFWTFILVAALFLCTFVGCNAMPNVPVNTNDGSYTSELDFYPLSDGTYAVKAGNALYLEEIIIPSTYRGKAVTQIAPHAFEGAIYLKSITIPDTITSIGDYAFSDCVSLTDVTVPNNVKIIGQYAFSD